METLQYGYLLMDRRQRLQALANWLTPDRARARVAVEKAMITAWRSRDQIRSEADLDPHLRRWFLIAMAEPWPSEAGVAEESATDDDANWASPAGRSRWQSASAP